EVLADALHRRMKSEVLTSATLTVDRDFRYYIDRTGVPEPKAASKPRYDEEGMEIREIEVLPERPLETLLLDTPFNYREQVFFGVPNDLPDPRSSDFAEQLSDFICRAVAVSGGRAFILFTSFAQMRQVADLCE